MLVGRSPHFGIEWSSDVKTKRCTANTLEHDEESGLDILNAPVPETLADYCMLKPSFVARRHSCCMGQASCKPLDLL